MEQRMKLWPGAPIMLKPAVLKGTQAQVILFGDDFPMGLWAWMRLPGWLRVGVGELFNFADGWENFFICLVP